MGSSNPPWYRTVLYPKTPTKLGFHQENVFRWTKVVLNTTGPPPSTMVLPVPLVHSWSTLILLGPLCVTTLQKLQTKVDQGGPGGPWGPWSWVLDQEHYGPGVTFCWCHSLFKEKRKGKRLNSTSVRLHTLRVFKVNNSRVSFRSHVALKVNWPIELLNGNRR